MRATRAKSGGGYRAPTPHAPGPGCDPSPDMYLCRQIQLQYIISKPTVQLLFKVSAMFAISINVSQDENILW